MILNLYLFARNHEHEYLEEINFCNFRVDLYGLIFADVEILITLCGLIIAVAKNVMFISPIIVRGKTNFCKITKDITV